MKIEETKEITEMKRVTTGIKCDVCGKFHSGDRAPDDWHSFNHHHSEWGNDSIDSYVYHDVCSPKCYLIKFKECVNDLSGRRFAQVDGLDIEFARKLSIYLHEGK